MEFGILFGIFLTLFYSYSRIPGTHASASLHLSPKKVVVKFGDSVSVNCSTNLKGAHLGFEAPHDAVHLTSVQMITWKPRSVTEWGLRPFCYMTTNSNHQEELLLDIVLYKPPDRVSISTRNSSEPLKEGQQYDLRCDVQDVAPVNLLTVNWYRGGVLLESKTFNDRQEKKPVSVNDTLTINASRSDNGIEFWCETVLKLGPEGPQPPPTVTSERLSFNVHYQKQATSGASELRSWRSVLITFSRVERGLLVLSHCELLIFTLIVGVICKSMM